MNQNTCNLFWVVILENPKQKKDEEPELPAILYGPEFFTAKNDMAAAMKAITGQAALLAGKDMDRIQVLVRPF